MDDLNATTAAPTAPAAGPAARLGAAVGRLGGKLGIGVAVLGFLVIFLGWNGAASFNDLRQQFPYLISGGLAGLALVTIGAALLIVENSRRERAELLAVVAGLTRAVEGLSGVTGGSPDAGRAPVLLDVRPGQVLAGRSSFHRPDCLLVEGRTEVSPMAPSDAVRAGLQPCRVCGPASDADLGDDQSAPDPGGPDVAAPALVSDDGRGTRRRQLRAR